MSYNLYELTSEEIQLVKQQLNHINNW